MFRVLVHSPRGISGENERKQGDKIMFQTANITKALCGSEYGD